MNQSEITFRPKEFKSFIGQQEVVDRLKITLNSAKFRNTVIDHILLAGPSGLGKTTLANIIANKQNGKLHTIAAPAIEKAGDLAATLTQINEGDVVFIDEIHRLHPGIEEFLYPPMEDYRLDLFIDSNDGKKAVSIELPKFTLVAATTKPGNLTRPLKTRFSTINTLKPYNIKELQQIILNNKEVLGKEITEDAALEIAKVSRGTPRIANNLSKWCRDYSIHLNCDINLTSVKSALNKYGINSIGLNEIDVAILKALIHTFKNNPTGIKSLATAINQDPITIEEDHEPFLIQNGWLERTVAGRIATKLANELNL